MTSLHASKELQEKFKDINPFILYKWEKMFKTIFDANSSDEVDWNDYYLVMKRVRTIYGYDSAQMGYAKGAMKALWQGLIDKADKNHDEQVSTEEWIALLTACEPAKRNTWYNDYCIMMFKLFDVSGRTHGNWDWYPHYSAVFWDLDLYIADQKLDMLEYSDGMQTYGAEESASKEAFKRFSVDGKGKPLQSFDLTHFKKLWDDFFYSTDPNAPGNHLFGVLE